jgi:heterodisulfide reductase subunit A
VGRPLRLKVDMLILAVGMTSTRSDELFARHPAVDQYPSGFLRPRDMFAGNVLSWSPSIFYAGTVTAPKNVGESMNEGAAAAQKVYEHLCK